ncbi:MAG: hpch/hpai aldolase [Boseongicola sp. SB0667_bin_21]|nr:hpch/hpai aldolase [Boseongicola sp. SB0667_bin_21]
MEMEESMAALTRSRSPKIGHYVGEFATPGIGHMLASAGCEFVFFDMEHSGFGFETLKQVLRYFEAADVPAIVRAPSKDYDGIARLCDAGAEGIMAPMIGNSEEAARILHHMKYPPVGGRGVALGSAHDNFQHGGVPVAERLESANKRTTFFALIETREGAENADEIAATPGVDCLWVGHFDLSASLGIPGQFNHPDYLEALNRIVAAAKKHDRSLGRLVSSPQEGLQDIEQGFDFICYGTDTAIYQGALVHGVSALRDAARNG